MDLPKKLQGKLQTRIENNSLRKLSKPKDLIDFSSNDYLGFSSSVEIFQETHQYLQEKNFLKNGATGSRLISGNHSLYNEVEKFLCDYHKSEAALIFNSGYDANIGFFASVPQRGDVVLYDELSHASIRDGITMSHAKSFKFRHNDLSHLEEQLQKLKESDTVYVVTESVFSMDGDSPNLEKITELTNAYNAFLIVDEAHALGVFGNKGVGLIQKLGLEEKIFARIVTFGKALGCHGAVILANNPLREYLINFARSFIYTTGLPPHSLATILKSYEQMQISGSQEKLRENIQFFTEEVERMGMSKQFILSSSAIHSCIIPGNRQVKQAAKELQEKGFDVKAILSPTVPQNEERLRFCLHAYNSFQEITAVLEALRIFVVA
ncbi:aminotransferase class I/II-fold pyridoxal phosphate-dependent enzyme [Pseudotenacibaculum haliotis]|uniref:Aminotransferase class I/II-fold pyridoxal phosphate-dependent enzyme n=1 Tax=Pseudotenacibaculum haliotis TaxID=1862138 RepID=A0ABW5LSD0_9FLAO